MADAVVCSCLKCGAWIGNFENLWDRIGKTYYTPILITDDLGGLVKVGQVREASKTGVIENSFLQDLACENCGAIMGLRCENAPTSHVLTKNQLILRIGCMKTAIADTGKKAVLRVRRTFSLTGSGSPSAEGQGGCEPPISPTGNSAPIKHVSPQSDGEVASFNGESDPLRGLVRFAEWAEDAITAQKEEVDRMSTIVTKIEQDMRSFKGFMIETRKDLLKLPKGDLWINMKSSVRFLEEEMDSIKKELEARPAVEPSRNIDDVKISAEELDVLTSSITTISQKVNEVESLKIELQFMKSRLKRFEDASRSAKQSIETATNESQIEQDWNSNQKTPLLQRGTRGIPKLAANESTPGPSHNANQSWKFVPETMPEANVEQERIATPSNENRSRKRRSEEYESDLALEVMQPSAVNSQKKGKQLEPALKNDPQDSPGRTNHRPRRSLLRNVRYVDELPDNFDSETPTHDSNDDHNWDNEPRRRAQRAREREYDSAPESAPRRRGRPPASLANNTRDSSSPEEVSPRLADSSPQLKHKERTMPKKRRRRRATPERRYNADGIRITKLGVPDRRKENYAHLQRYWDRRLAQKKSANAQKEDETQEEQENAEKDLDGEGVGEEEPLLMRRSGGGEELDGEEGEQGEEGTADVMPSVEAETKAAITGTAGVAAAAPAQTRRGRDSDRPDEASKRGELEARERLVKETLERELTA